MTGQERSGLTPSLNPGALRDFETFSTALIALNGKLPDRIVRQIYTAAMMKASLDIGLTLAQQGTKSLRRTRTRLSHLHALLERALRSLKAVEDGYLHELEIPERFRARHGYVESRSGVRLSKIQNKLKGMSGEIADAESTYAALIHPKLRTPPEKRLARQAPPSIRDISDSPVWHDSPQIDHLFIGQIAACLGQFETATSSRAKPRGKKLATSASFFRQIFEAAFGIIKEEGSIAKELQRQRTNGREFFIEPSLLEPYPSVTMPLGFVLLAVGE